MRRDAFHDASRDSHRWKLVPGFPAEAAQRRRRVPVFLLLFLTLALAGVARADRVTLKNGDVVEGQIVLDNEGRIVIRTAKGIRTIRREEVRKVEKEKAPPKPKPPAPKPEDPPEEEEPAGTGETTPETTGVVPGPEKNREEAQAEWKRKTAEYEGVPWTRRWKVRRPGFVLHCNSTKEVAEWYATALEKIDHELKRFFRKAEKVRFENEETKVFVYKTEEEFQRLTGTKFGGFFRIQDGSIHAYHGRFDLTGDTVSVLGHEYTHKWEAKVVDRWFNMPPWIYEGLAVYFGDGVVVPREGRAKAQQIPRDRLLAIQRAIREKRYIKIKELMETPPGPKFTGFHYAHAWSVIYMLVNTNKGNRDIFNKVFTDCIQSRHTIQDFADVCKRIGGIEGFEVKWKEWVMEQEIPPAGVIRDSTFRSELADFTVTLPDETWAFDLDSASVGTADLLWFQAVMKKEKALVKVLAGNNWDHLTPEEAVKRKLEVLGKTNKVIFRDEIVANGYDAHEIYYTSDPPPPSPPKEGEEPKEGEKPEPKPEEPPGEDEEKPEDETPKEPLKKMRRVYFTTVPQVVIVELSAPVDEFDRQNTDFEKVLQTIQFHFE